jgi:hypothetical protein
MIIEYNGIKYKMEYDKSLNMTLLYNLSEEENNNELVNENVSDINNVLDNLKIDKIDSENTITDKFPDNVVGYWCKVLNTIVLL